MDLPEHERDERELAPVVHGSVAWRMMMVVPHHLPAGTVTFLFSDVEGSTNLLNRLGADRYAEALGNHRRTLRMAFGAHGGVEVDTQGDAFFVAFPTAPGALQAAAAGVAGLARGPIRVRMGIHTGTPLLSGEGYVGVDVHRAARIAAAGHGGQVLVSESTASLVGTHGLTDLGEHRLKDLSAPERIYQLGDDKFPPLKSLYRTNLPVPGTPFIGRKHELAQVLELLAQEGVRLLTLTGPGGTGKTRLGLQVAAEVAGRHPDGVFWVPLATLRDSELVVEAARHALGVKDGLAEEIADKRLLLVFDNFEQVVEAADELSELLAACPNLRLIITSRELLRVPGEQAYPVPPLEPQDGTNLFLARARAVLPEFVADETVPRLCAQLEQLPLAIELAAARIRVLSPAQLLERLSGRLDLLKAERGVDPRQRTLRATIEWSYALLDTDEQALFARLAVFAGGCTLEMAEKVCGADLDTLQSLVDKSLVRVREGDRFLMLETIREYAIERLSSLPQPGQFRRRHAYAFLHLAEVAGPRIVDRGGGSWLDRLEQEQHNLRDALMWFCDGELAAEAMRMTSALWRFWQMRGHLVEARQRIDVVLRLPSDDVDPVLRLSALEAAGGIAYWQGDVAGAEAFYRACLDESREVNDRAWVARSLSSLAYALRGVDPSSDEALRTAEEALAEFRELEDVGGVAGAVRLIAILRAARDELAEARVAAESARQLFERLDRPFDLAWALRQVGVIAMKMGDLRGADAALREALRLLAEIQDVSSIPVILGDLAALARAEGDADRAAQLSGAAAALQVSSGAEWARVVNGLEKRPAASQHGPASRAAMAEDAGMSVDDAVEYALGAIATRTRMPGVGKVSAAVDKLHWAEDVDCE